MNYLSITYLYAYYKVLPILYIAFNTDKMSGSTAQRLLNSGCVGLHDITFFPQLSSTYFKQRRKSKRETQIQKYTQSSKIAKTAQTWAKKMTYRKVYNHFTLRD